MAAKKASKLVKLFGTEVPDGKKRELKAGDLTATLDNGAIRYIRYRGKEVLRGIAFLVRDKNWGTYTPEISNLKVANRAGGFRISYSATCRDADQSISYDAAIVGNPRGTLSFHASATPGSDFLTNRTGFVVLHPLVDVVGKPVEIVHTDGKKEKSRFPKFISPGQPVFEIRSLKHEVMPGVSATVLMEGNKFEMEDHRNWMDASYKTYVCSLLDPWPYTLPKGKTFEQVITVTIEGKPKGSSSRREATSIPVTLGAARGRLPSFAAGVPMLEAKAALTKADLIAEASPAALICQIDGRNEGQAEAARNFAELSRKTGSPVALEIVLPAAKPAMDEMAGIAKAAAEGGLKPSTVIVTQAHDLKSFQPGAKRPWGPTYEEMAAAARKHFPGARLGGGMLSYFTELNRKPVPKGLFDFVTHTTCPIVHAADDVSVMETLEALPSIFASTRNMIGKTPYHIGPTSIPCRDNPYGAAVASNKANGRVCLADVDPRQRGLFAAAWSLGYAAAAAEAGIDELALGSVTGPQGMIHGKAAWPQPWFKESDAEVYPVYHVFAGLAPHGNGKRFAALSANPSKIAALALATKPGPVLWLANLTGETQAVSLSGLKGKAMLHMLDEVSFEKAATNAAFMRAKGKLLASVRKLELGPYAVARLSPHAG
jgi:hypothetical protein